MSGKMKIGEFAEFIKDGVKSADKEEIDLLFKVLDKQGKGYLAKEDLFDSMSKVDTYLHVTAFITPNDILLPFQTVLQQRKQIKPKDLWKENVKEGKISMKGFG